MTAVLVLTGPVSRAKAARWCGQAPDGSTVTFRRPVRSLAQNARMWAMLTDVSQQVEHHGQKYRPDEWKDIFTAALGRFRLVPGLDAGTIVPLGMRTSEMSKDQLGDLMELISAYGAEKGVVWGDEANGAASP
jgi:hypothetical protein